MTDHIMTPSEKLRSIASSIGIVCIANAIREVAEEIEHTAPVASQDMRIVPVWLLERVERSLGAFTSDEGWAQTDMDTMDSVSALLAATPAHTPAVPQGEADRVQREIAAALALFPIDISSQTFRVSGYEKALEADDDTQFFSRKKVMALLEKLYGHLTAAATPATAPAQGEPFGHFRAEPFGWTDCAKDDEGAIALYERPQEVGLTDEEIKHVCAGIYLSDHPQGSASYDVALARAIIAALRAKGGK